MKSKNTKAENIRYGEVKQVRLTKGMNKQLKSKALEQNTSESEIIRQAIINYINRNMNDSEIIHASLNEMSRKIQMMSDKLELLALIVMQQTKFLIGIFPNNDNINDELTELNFKDFQTRCMQTLKRNHIGILESMLLDFYESGDNESDGN